MKIYQWLIQHFILAFAGVVLSYSSVLAAGHPMDALSSDEIESAIQVLTDAGHLEEQADIPMMSLIEMPKADVLAWKAGQPIQRRAFVNVRQAQTVFEGDVDLTNGTVLRWQEIPGVQSQQVFADIIAGQKAMEAHPPWQEALARRGYDNLDDVSCFPVTPGYFNLPDEQNRRIGRVYCYDKTFGPGNTFAHPVEGLYGAVDLDTGEVLDVIDTGFVPVSQDDHFYEEKDIDTRPRMKPVRQNTPRGSNAKISGSEVSWQNWSFHMRMERRDGLVLSLIKYRDGEVQRSVIYQIHASEMFVPYMDSSPGWYFRTFLDTGEYGFGAMSTPLVEGLDCPRDAIYRDAVLPNASGEPETAESVLCLFERNTGRPLWRHAADQNKVLESRPDVELVVRTIPTIGNYDYVIDYVFTLHGNMRVDVGATGIDAVKGVVTQHMDDESAAEDTATGELVAPGLVAVWHDHFLSFRVDLDVDGTSNSLETAALTPHRLSESEGPRRSLYGYKRSYSLSEGAVDHSGHGEVWRVINETKKTSLGHHPGYHIETGHQAMSKLSANDYPQQRAAFTASPLWITRYDANERYAAGAYPTQSRGGDGLPVYTSDAASVRNEDVVLWVTMGFHHPTRVEDWPMMPAKWHQFTLRPFNFFDRNPSIDVPSKFRRSRF